MRLKTYFASGIDAAMSLARQELGPEAMLVHSKRTAGETQSLGNYEVVFAVGDTPSASATPANVPPVSSPADASASWGSSILAETREDPANGAEIARLTRLMEQTLRLVRRSEVILKSKQPLEGEMADLEAALEDAGFSADFRQRIPLELPDSSASIRQRVLLWLERQLRVSAQLGRPGYVRKAVALVGPPGAGKTTTLIKFAARYGVASRRPAQILSMDADRVGASEVLRMHAGVLGIGFQLLDSVHALSQALAEHAHKDLILIDTPGFASRNLADAGGLSAFLVSRKEIETHLVLPADLPFSGLRSHLANYGIFEPAKLIFTRLDEMQNSGAMIETAIFGRIPISYVSYGQRVPEDLTGAEKSSLLDPLLPRWTEIDSDPRYSRTAAA